MMNIGVGTILTKGLGGPACNMLIFGSFRLYIEPFNVPTPTPVPTATVPTVGGGGGGGRVRYPPVRRDEDDELDKYKLTFNLSFRGRDFKKSFVVDSFKKDKIVCKVNQINALTIKFKTTIKKIGFKSIMRNIKNNRFIVKWKK